MDVDFNSLLFALTFVGAFALYMGCMHRNIQPFSLFNAFRFKIEQDGGLKCFLLIFLDSVLTSMFGAVLAYFATSPVSNIQAITAGLSFTGIISTYGSREESSDEQ